MYKAGGRNDLQAYLGSATLSLGFLTLTLGLKTGALGFTTLMLRS